MPGRGLPVATAVMTLIRVTPSSRAAAVGVHGGFDPLGLVRSGGVRACRESVEAEQVPAPGVEFDGHPVGQVVTDAVRGAVLGGVGQPPPAAAEVRPGCPPPARSRVRR